MRMIKQIVVLFLLVVGSSFASEEKERINLNYELKIGITPMKWYGGKRYSERYKVPVDYGFEVYHQGKIYSLGVGVEGKIEDEYEFIDGLDEIYTYYVVGKRKIGHYYSLVFRAGGASPINYKPSYYGAFGIEKRIGSLNIQLLGEILRLKDKKDDKKYPMIGLKLGYVFGKSFEESELKPPVETPAPEIERAPEAIEKEEIASGYVAYQTELNERNRERVKKFVEKINQDERSGVLELRAYSDDTGSEKLNVELAEMRLESVVEELETSGLDENKEIKKIDPVETIKTEYKFDNDSLVNREANRRIEATFIAD